jgi:hypothetical protein
LKQALPALDALVARSGQRPTTKIDSYNQDVDTSAQVGILFHTNRVILPEPGSEQRLSYL